MKILSKPKGNAEEYGRWAVNPYLGCPNGCEYCYLKKGPGAKNLGGDRPQLKAHVADREHAYHLAMAEIIENREQIRQDGGLFMTFTSDPLTEANRDLMLSIAYEALLEHLPVTLLTKDATFFDTPDYVRLLSQPYVEPEDSRREVHFWHVGSREYRSIRNPHVSDHTKKWIAFGFTLTGHDSLEPRASLNAERLQAMKRLSEAGYRTWASVEPVITFDDSWRMVQQALDAGCHHLKIGLLTDRTRVVRRPFTLGGQEFPAYDREACCQFVEFVMAAVSRYGATVYWKQSVEDFLAGPNKKDPQPVHGMTAREFLGQWELSVGADWSMF